MLDILSQTLPFFALIGLGYWAGRRGIFPPEGANWLTKFVFFFALPAMLIKTGAHLGLSEIFAWPIVASYLVGSFAVQIVVALVARARGASPEEAAIEAQCGIIGNTGFMGVPMLIMIFGPKLAAPILLILVVDMLVFSTLLSLIIAGLREGKISPQLVPQLAKGVIANPMVMGMAIGLLWSASGIPVPATVDNFMAILGAAATPAALFAIGASLTGRGLERVGVAVWLSGAKLLLHPLAVGLCAFFLFPADPLAAAILTAASALPVAGNVYILAAHYNVAPQRASAAILISTTVSILTLTVFIAWASGFQG